MAGSVSLSKILEESELELLSAPIKEKLEQFFTSQNSQLEELKATHERLRVNSELEYLEVEKQLISSNSKLDAETNGKNDLQVQLTDIEKKYSEASVRLKELESAHEESQNSKIQLEKINRQLDAEKKELNQLLEKRNKEIERLNEECKQLKERVDTVNAGKCGIEAKLLEIQSKEVSREYQVKRLTQEKEHLQQQLDWTNNELQRKTNELVNFRKERAGKLLEVQSQLDEKTSEVKHLQTTLESVRKSEEVKAVKIDEYIKKLKDARDSQAQSDGQFRQELSAKAKLVDLYKASAEDNDIKVKEVLSAVEELQKLLKDATQAYTDLEKQKSDEANQFKDQLKEKDVKIGKLEEELVNANELLGAMKGKGSMKLSDQAVESLSPFAAATSKMLKSGMTLTQIYSEYAKASESLQHEQEENRRLNQYLDQIMQELEERAPLLVKQREDYESALRTINQITAQLDAAMLDCEKSRSEADEMRRKANHFGRENQKFQQQCVDLGQQVRYLIKEVQELRGGRVVREEDGSSNEVSSSSNLITEKLVTFRNIEELQEQNQRLLEVVRELSEKQEEEERQATETKTQELREQLETAQKELEEFRNARTAQAEMVESIVRQRDMYRVLLQQGGNIPPSIAPIQTSTPLPAVSRGLRTPGVDIQKSLDETKTALKELQAEYTTYKKERSANEKMISNQLDKTQQELSDFRVQNAKLSSQLDFSAERYKVLQGNAESYRKEIAALQEKNRRYSASVMKHETTINTLREDLMAAQENMTRFEVRNQNLCAECELLKTSEQRLVQELESVRREQQSQNLLLGNLQAIQNNLERAEFETKTRVNNQIEAYEREVNSLRRKMDVQSEERRAITKNWENLVKNLQMEVDREKKANELNKEKLEESEKSVQSLKQELSTAEAKAAALEVKLSKLGVTAQNSEKGGSTPHASGTLSASAEEIKDLKAELEQTKQQVKVLKNHVETAKKHANQYKAIADSVEQNLKEQNQTSKEFQQNLEQRVTDLKQVKEQLEKRMDEMEKERQELLNENIRISEESHTLNADLRKQLASLQNELQAAVQRREEAIASEENAKHDCQEQIKIAAEAQNKYERELMLHAADVEALTASKKQMESFSETLDQQKEAANKAKQHLLESQTSWSEQERILREECRMLETRVKELTEQNNVLHGQMQKLSGQVITIQKKVSADAANLSIGEDTAKSSDQLLEVIRFLRRDKQIAETKLEVVQAECNRVNQQFHYLEKQLEDANKTLTEERQRSQVSLQTAAQHADLMRKVENLNLLSDSNKLLRDERDRLQQHVTSLEAKLKKAEGDIDPLQTNIRTLQAQRDTLVVEKGALQSEVDRWKSRTNHLIEQANKSDPEEHRRMVQERESMRRQLAQMNEERLKHRAEVSKLNANLAACQTELNTVKNQISQLNLEGTGLKKQIEDKNVEAEEKMKTINQLKKIGRKYKEQTEKITKDFEEMKKEFEEVKSKSATQAAAQPNMAAIEQASAELKSKLQNTEKERDELKGKVELKEGEVNGIKEQLQKIQQDMSQLQEAQNKMKEENTEYEKKQAHSRSVLQTAKNKLTNQREQLEKLTGENAELKKKMTSIETTLKEENELRLGTIKSQYETKLSRMEKDLQEAKTTGASQVSSDLQQLERLQRENTELHARIQALQKQLEVHMKHIQPQPAVLVSRPAATAPPSVSSAEAPRMANIKPMATGVVAVRQTTPIPYSAAAAKATASIRPMAIAPASAPSPSTSGSSATPTATVMPTTVSQQEVTEDETPSTSAPQVATIPSATIAGRPQQVQIVAPQIETPVDTLDLVEETVPTPVPVVTNSPEQVPTQQPVQPMPSSAGTTVEPSGTQQQGKRQREDTESQEDSETQAKRTRVTQESPIPTIIVTDEHANSVNLEAEMVQSPQVHETPVPVMLVPQQILQDDPPATQPEPVVLPLQVLAPTSLETMFSEEPEPVGLVEEPAQMPPQVLMQQLERTDLPPSQSDTEVPGDVEDNDEIIIVPSDDEDEEEQDFESGQPGGNQEEYMDDDEDAEEYDPAGEEDDDDEEEYVDDEDEDEEDEEHEEGMQQDQAEDDEDNDVVIIDIDDGDQQVEAQQTPGGQPAVQQAMITQQVTITPHPPPPLQPIGHSERLPSIGRAQLTPFMLGQGQPGAFEDDDCTVPSTPTLSVPRRGDGFAEALNSPQVPQRFVFGSSVEGLSQPELAQLESQRALGMDDTRMDLSQFDDGGRSVPTTPNPSVTSAVAVTEPQTQQTGATPTSTSTVPPSEPATPVSEVLSGESKAPEGHLEGEQESQDIEDETVILEAEQGDEEEGTEQETGEVKPDGETGEGHEGDVETVETSSRQVDSGDDRPSTSQEKQDSSVKPRIQRIVWETSGSSSSPPQHTPPQQTATPTAVPIRGRGIQSRGLRRGVQRAIRGYWRGQNRGRPMRGNYRSPHF